MKHILNTIAISTAMILAQSFPSFAQVGPGNLGGIGTHPVCTRDINGSVNIRAGAGQKYKVLTQVPNGNFIQVLKPVSQPDGYVWYNVRYGNVTGWARQDYICNFIGGNSPEFAYVCTHDSDGSVNLRATVGQQGRIVTKAYNGNEVQPVGVQLGTDGFFWQKVRYGNTVGWVRGDYLCVNYD